MLYVSFGYCYIANVTIISCLLTSLEEILRAQHQTSFLYSPRAVAVENDGKVNCCLASVAITSFPLLTLAC